MFGLFKRKEKTEKVQAEILYTEVVSAARIPYFYGDLHVPDNIDGRFEMISLHEALILIRLEELGKEAAELAQELFDRMFLDMDRSLREMGISDLSVPKHMKRMLNGFNGRAQAYKEALQEQSDEKLFAAVKRNIYGTIDTVTEPIMEEMLLYIRKQWQQVGSLSLQDFQNGLNIFIKVGKT